MTTRPLHAVLLPPGPAGGGRLRDLLSDALAGTGPAILPLDPALPRVRLDELLAAFAPATVETPDYTENGPSRYQGRDGASPGVAEDVAVVLATSGSTGRPKGAEITASALLASARASLARLGTGQAPIPAAAATQGGATNRGATNRGATPAGKTPAGANRAGATHGGATPAGKTPAGKTPAGANPAGANPADAMAAGGRWLAGLPLHHISGLGILVRSLVTGTDPVLVPRIDAAALAAAAEDGCEYVSLVPAQLRRLLDEGAAVAAFRRILLGGAPVPAGMLDEAAAAGASVVTSYGMTETCGGCVYDGVPLDGVLVAAGPDGRIEIGGPVLFSRYRLAPEATGAALRDGWFVTSDLGGFGADGRLVIRGRADDVINSGGEKVVAAEVEEALRDCRSVRDAVVVGVPDPLWGELVTALVVPADPGAPPTLERLREQVSSRLPRYAAPRALLLVTEIPMLASGKPDRQRLRELISSGRATSTQRTRYRTGLTA